MFLKAYKFWDIYHIKWLAGFLPSTVGIHHPKKGHELRIPDRLLCAEFFVFVHFPTFGAGDSINHHKVCLFFFTPCMFYTHLTGVIELPIVGGIKQCRYIIINYFRHNSALFGLVKSCHLYIFTRSLISILIIIHCLGW